MFSTHSEPTDTSLTRPWPADQIERWPIERLKRYANNPRRHSEADLGKIAASIRQWGWTMPVLVGEDGELICGDARLSAAILLELRDIPVIVAKGGARKKSAPIASLIINWRCGEAGPPTCCVTSCRRSTLPILISV